MSKNRSKRYKSLLENKANEISLEEAISRVKQNSNTKFVESVELAINTGLDPRHSDQTLRGVCKLPHGSGKSVKVAVIANENGIKSAKESGADLVGCDDIIEDIKKGVINFDKLIATPDMMAKLGAVARILGPKGLMPNPKLGTVTMDIANAVKDAKAGSVEYRAEKAGIVHVMVGKASFAAEQLVGNIKGLLSDLIKNKPSGAKGAYIKSVYLSTTMGISYKINVEEFTQ